MVEIGTRGAPPVPRAAGAGDGPGAAGDGPVAVVLSSLVTTLSAAVLVGLALVGFVGGTVPVVGFHLPGGVVSGLAFLPVAGTAALVAFGLLVVASAAVSAAAEAVSRLLRTTARDTRRPEPIAAPLPVPSVEAA